MAFRFSVICLDIQVNQTARVTFPERRQRVQA